LASILLSLTSLGFGYLNLLYRTEKKSDNQNISIKSKIETDSSLISNEKFAEVTNVKFSLKRKDVVIKRYAYYIFHQISILKNILESSFKMIFLKFLSSILRSMKKYYINYILSNTKYRRDMRNIKHKHRLLIESSVESAQKLKMTSVSNSMPFYIMAVAFPTDFKKILMKAAKSMQNEKNLFLNLISKINKVELAMIRFSIKTLEDFIGINEVSLLLQHYLSKVENSRYTSYYKMLNKLSGYVLTSLSKPDALNMVNEVILDEVKALNLILMNSLF
jgi:membrane protein YqaA with SNARE-associated domain